ncbi:MAG TPA: GMC family oxidoreductase N-terminal domain-containing protein [Methanobacteriaceae archaeon]|nr:GMC family oxidoreductase N-terminal domain-containing protein [Methanobacteriaceae archaeon]
MKKILVVGSGAGGGIIAKELAIRGLDVTILEKGPGTPPGEAYNHYETINTGVEISKTDCIGGTTMVTVGNAVRTCQKYLNQEHQIDLEKEFEEVEMELSVNTLPDSLFGTGTRLIMDHARNIGFTVSKMPKFIDPRLCKPCGKCAMGCPRDAKWTSQRYLKEAINAGAVLIDNSPVTDIIIENGILKGVKTIQKEYLADIVVLCAGAIETPRLLQKIGINAGKQLFVDTFITVGGVLKGVGFQEEVQMNALIKRDGLILAPHYSSMLVEKLPGYAPEDILGIMIKITDENIGKITIDSVTKYNTAHDVELLAEGAAVAGSILTAAGVDPTTLVSTPARGAHPGGTAAIGQIVDSNLETEIEGLFVADASVLPRAPGAPPILTILALAKRLGKYLREKRV